MSQSSFGKKFVVTTWGESHGKAIGAVLDGCPAGLSLCEEDIQVFLDRRKPGQSRYTTARKEEIWWKSFPEFLKERLPVLQFLF